MAITLDQMLALAGRLDDSREFDAPRERFRRFLREYVGDVATLRALVDQARYSPDDQHRRALQDLVVLAGRFLGFEVDLGAPAVSSTAPAHHGAWHAPGRLRVIVEVGTSARPSPPAASQPPGSADPWPLPGTPAVNLLVLATVPVMPREAHSSGSSAGTRVMTVNELLDLADMAAGGRLAPVEIVRMLEAGIPVDFVAGLLDRPASGSAHAAETPPTADAPSAVPSRGTTYWIASVPPDYATTPEEFLELVVGRRHVFGVTDRGTVVGTVRTGDGICFFLPGKGVVGHAWVASIAEGALDLRDARRFRQVLRLDRLALHLARPHPLDLETELRLRAAPIAANRHAQMLLQISPESFRILSKPGSGSGEGDDDTDGGLTDEGHPPGRGRLSG